MSHQRDVKIPHNNRHSCQTNVSVKKLLSWD